MEFQATVQVGLRYKSLDLLSSDSTVSPYWLGVQWQEYAHLDKKCDNAN